MNQPHVTVDNTTPPSPPQSEPVAPQQVLIPAPTRFVRPNAAGLAEPGAEPEPAINVRSVLHAFRRRWFSSLLLGLVLGAATAYAVWMVVPAPYTAYTQIRVRSVMPTVPLHSANNEPQFETYKQTLMQLVRGREVLEAALRSDGVSSGSLFDDIDESQVELLQRKLEIKSNSTEFFRISLSGDDPDELKKIVLAVTNAFKRVVVDADRTALDERRKRYEKFLEQEEIKLQRLREALQLLVKDDATNSKAFVERQRGILTERASVRQQLADIELKIMKLKIDLDLQNDRSSKLAKEPIPQVVIDAEMADDSAFHKAKADFDEKQSRYDRWKKRATPNHPKLVKAKDALAAAKKEIDALRKKKEPEVRKRLQARLLGKVPKSDRETEVELAVLSKQRAYLLSELQKRKVEQRAAGLNDVEIEKQTEMIADQRKYTQALKDTTTRMEAELKILDAEPRVKVPTQAEVSSRPDMKKKYMATAVAGFGMFGFILGGILLMDIRLKRISSLQQVADKMGLPIVGAIPAMPRLATTKRAGDWSSKARYWHSVLTESVDSARTVLLREADQSQLQVLMVASAMGGEGKTTVSCHLATSLARAGRNVLLIDGDMRRPTIHRTFDVPLQPGFADLLTSSTDVASTLQESGIPGLTVLPAGKLTQRALENLAQDRPGELLADLREQFEFIIFDSAPVLPVTDSLMVAQLVDAVLMTIRRDVSRASKVLAGCERLHKLGVPLLGAIAVGLDDESYGYGYSYRYGYDPYHSMPRD
jgi:polysaccharide biosynthesis transport protein